MQKNVSKIKSNAPEHYSIIIIGAGPSGLSAAIRAAEHQVSYLLLEAEQAPASTIRSYLRGKLVMAEPRGLPLRSPLPFTCLLYTSLYFNIFFMKRCARPRYVHLSWGVL